jgi:hypothetical protein
VAAWVADAQVTDLLGVWEQLAGELPVLLVTMIDSDPEPSKLASVRAAIADAAPDIVVVGPGIAVPSGAIHACASTGLFTGFDELWLACAVPEHFAAPPVRLTSETPIRAMPDQLLEWMDRHGCRLGFGDGDGLNVVGDSDLVATAERYLTSRGG